MSELEYCAFCDGGYAHLGICDKCTTEIGQTGEELADKEKQLAEAQELIKKLRRCANCKHKIGYVRFGEVATACALDVNEEENQTCKNFDKWEAE